ncbi:MAG: DUF3592 domain-containing protein [Candidatus Saccharimonadales bacterium]
MNISFNSQATSLKVKRQTFGVFSLIFLLLFGAVFAGAGIFAINNSKIDSEWTRTTGEVVDSSSSISDGSTTYTPIVQYKVNGQSYKVTSSTGSSFYPNIGDTREIAYNPNRPDQAKVAEGAGSQALLWLFPAIGIGVLVLAPILFVRSMQRSNKINSLMQSGYKLSGVLVDIQTTNSNDTNNTYKIVVAATDNAGAVQNYVSDSLTGIGGLAMADFRTTPIPIDVYIDPSNAQNYYVDVSDIPNLTPQRIGELLKSAVNANKPQTIVNAQQQTTETVEPPTLTPKF